MAAESTNDFGWKLLNLLVNDNGKDNLFLSPFSISVALSMTRLGAKNETATGMEKALCWRANGDDIHKEFQKYIESLKKPNDGYILRTANRIYVEEGYTILDDFLKQTQKTYSAEPIAAKFIKAPEAEAVNINTWVEQQTENKIKNLIPPGIIDSLTRLVLVNAIYFKGQWENKFDSRQTQPKPFFVSPNMEVSVPMMSIEKKLPYYETDGYSVLELPYKGGQLSMCIFLPTEQFGLEALEQKLTVAEIKDALSKLHSRIKINVLLPKFEICSSFKLKKVLSQAGMAEAFSQVDADFSGMTGERDLCISEVVHKAFLKVNEEGSEAAAATAAVMMMRCAMIMETPNFHVDHPFIVVIRDKTNDMILFLGHVTNPSESS